MQINHLLKTKIISESSGKLMENEACDKFNFHTS